MANSSARITLSVGNDGGGPRTVGEINAFGLSFALYQAWMHMAVFGAAKTFRSSDLTPLFPAFDVALQPLVIYAFLVASALCLFFVALASRSLLHPLPQGHVAAVASSVSFVGTAFVFVGTPLGAVSALVGGVLMGIGSSVFLVGWGVAFSGFRFATSVINSAIAFALGFMVTVAFVDWMPAPLSGIIALLLPILMTAASRGRTHASVITSNRSIDNRYLRGYLLRLASCLVLFGVVLGALRSICGTQMLSFGNIAIELVLEAGCFVSIVILVGAMIATKRETSWDSLFRIISPVVVLGIVGLTSLLGDFAILGCFFVSIGYVCFEALLWIFLTSMAKSMYGSSVPILGLGCGILQAASILGVIAEGALIGDPEAMTHAAFEVGSSSMALMLVTVIAFGYAILPRYRELKAVLASMVLASTAQARHEEGEWSVSDGIPATADASEGDSDGLSTETSTTPAAVASGETITATDDDAHANAGAGYALGPSTAEVEYAITATHGDGEIDVSDYVSEPQPEKGSFMRRCDEIVGTYLLSEREKEVLILLAKGHNAAFIQDKLCISRSTAKTHINHIYKKLDIHTHQELLTMVEDRQRGPATYSRNAS